jgi:ABC-type antimicrobial peptide transport system permease subunit
VTKVQPGIFRGKLEFENQFTQIHNAWVRDPKLSYKAKGLLTYLLSHEVGYTITIGQIIRESGDGRQAVRSALDELIQIGYLETQRTTDQRGYNAGLAYFIKDPKNPKGENPTLDNPTLDNRTAKENNLIKNKNKEDKETENLFNEFWLLYPRKVGKADAVKAWNKAIKLETPKRLLELTKAYSEGKLPEMTYIPYPASWLNKGLYESIELAEAKPLPKLFVGRIK